MAGAATVMEMDLSLVLMAGELQMGGLIACLGQVNSMYRFVQSVIEPLFIEHLPCVGFYRRYSFVLQKRQKR